MRCEVLFSIDADSADPRDGAPRGQVMPPGFRVSPTSMQEWWDGTDPAEAGQFDTARLEIFQRQMEVYRWMADAARTDREIAQLRYQRILLTGDSFVDQVEALLASNDREGAMAVRAAFIQTIRDASRPPTLAEARSLDDVTALLSAFDSRFEAARRRQFHTSEGIDYNWGRSDLINKGVAILDLSFREIHDLKHAPLDTSRHVAEMQRKRAPSRWRVDYRNLMSARSITDIHTPGLLVYPNRGGVSTPPTATEALVDA